MRRSENGSRGRIAGINMALRMTVPAAVLGATLGKVSVAGGTDVTANCVPVENHFLNEDAVQTPRYSYDSLAIVAHFKGPSCADNRGAILGQLRAKATSTVRRNGTEGVCGNTDYIDNSHGDLGSASAEFVKNCGNGKDYKTTGTYGNLHNSQWITSSLTTAYEPYF